MNNDSSNMYQTMSITSFGNSTLPKPAPARFQEKMTNDVSDISGASSGPKYKLYFDKPEPEAVEGSRSKALTHSRNVRDNTLYIDDIEGTRHTIKDRMMRTNRHVDPLNPNYTLPSFAPAEFPVPKFIKDSMNLKDIDGDPVDPRKSYVTRNLMKTQDITGAQPGWKPRHRKARLDAEPHDVMAVQDISAKSSWMDKTNRKSNVMNPHYNIFGMEIKDDKYTRPTEPKPLIADNALLQTQDIAGAYPGWRKTLKPRREYRNTNFLGDINGSGADSIKKGITTKRVVNPLTPVYQALDPGDLLLPLVQPLIPPEMVKIATLKAGIAMPGNQDTHMDYDPVQFTTDPASKPSSAGPNMTGSMGTGFHLDLSKSQGLATGFGGMTTSSPFGSSSNMHTGGGEPLQATGGRSAGRGGSGRNLSTQSMAAPVPQYRPSPTPSARLTPKQKVAIQDRMNEINSVRELY